MKLGAVMAFVTASLFAGGAAMAAEPSGSAEVSISTAAETGAARAVIDLETVDLTPADLSLQVDGSPVTAGPTPFGQGVVVPVGAENINVSISGAAGLDVRFVVSFVDSNDVVIAYAAQTVTLTESETETPIDITPEPIETSSDTGTTTGSMPVTGGTIALWLVIAALLAVAVGATTIVISRKRVQR